MTDRRPDVHCTGCGAYCHSLSHRPDEQTFPSQHFCTKCGFARERGWRRPELLNHWFAVLGQEYVEVYVRLHPERQPLRDGLRRFVLTSSRRYEPKELPRRHDRQIMTQYEWADLAMRKLKLFEKDFGGNLEPVLKFIEDVAGKECTQE